MTNNHFIFTSESVSEGHPDKIADKIADTILDNILEKDKYANVACEILLKNNFVVLAGEISNLSINIDYKNIIKEVIKNIGYNDSNSGFNCNNFNIINIIGEQSYEINNAIKTKKNDQQCAGDQGIVFGFATDETLNFMPAAINCAHAIMEQHSKIRKFKEFNYIKPDAKSQVTFVYKNNKPLYIDKIIVSTQHHSDINNNFLKEMVIKEIILPVIPSIWINKKTKYIINPSKKFVIGGPSGDCGLTGRKIICDTYGGYAKHGGGSFSGKDPSKIDRSAAYMARYLSKNIVAAKIAKKCEIQISYSIGNRIPNSIMIDSFGTSIVPDYKILEYIYKNFDLSLFNIIKHLDLLQPIYRKTTNYGHFGREKKYFNWEKLDKVKDLQLFFNS